DAQAPGEVVVAHLAAAGVPELEAGVGAVRELALAHGHRRAVAQVAAVPVAVALGLRDHRLRHPREHDATAVGLLAPAELRVGEVVGEVAVLDRPALAGLGPQTHREAAQAQVAQRDAIHVLAEDADALALAAAVAGTVDLRAVAVDDDVRRGHD